MFNLITLVGEVLRSNLVSSIINALIADAAVPAPNDAIKSTVNTAAQNTSVAEAAQSVVTAIVPALKTWTPEELSAAENAWASQQDPGNISANAAFAGGAAWVLAHQTSSLTTGIANACAASAMPGVVQAVERDALGVAGAYATGGTVGASAAAVGDVVAAAVEGIEQARSVAQATESGTMVAPKTAE